MSMGVMENPILDTNRNVMRSLSEKEQYQTHKLHLDQLYHP